MLDGATGGLNGRASETRPRDGRKPSRIAHRPGIELLECRQLLAASLSPISAVTVPSTLGYQLAVASANASTTGQTYTATSDNPDIKVSSAQGQFLTFNLSHTKASGQPTDVNINGPVTYQLFQDLTPKTAGLFESFVKSGFYSGKNIHRIADFGSTGAPSEFVYQGGSPNGDGTGNSGLPGTPYGVELNQQLAFIQPGTLAVAHSSLPNSNDTQFFVTNGPQTSLDFNYTIFGEQVGGYDISQQLTKVATTTNPSLGEKSQPVSPVLITSASLSPTNPNGVIHIDATGASPGETANVTVVATETATKTTTSRTFQVSVLRNTTPAPPATFTFAPLSTPVSVQTAKVTPVSVQLNATSNNPNNTAIKTVYSLVTQPAHGTVTNFNSATGAFTFTPAADFSGTETFQYRATNNGGNPATVPGNVSTVTINVAGDTPAPVTSPVTQQAASGTPVAVQLKAVTPNLNNPAVRTVYELVTPPAHGTVTNFNASAGTLIYTSASGFVGADTFQYRATNTGGNPSRVVGNTSTVIINVASADTGAVRVIGTALVVTPPPTTLQSTNTVVVSQTGSVLSPANQRLTVTLNGVTDSLEPLASSINRVVVFGSKARDTLTVDPSVDATIPVTLDGGHGGRNFLQAGAGSTREHGWFGQNTLAGGTGPNELIGRKGHVRFVPTSTTTTIFAGVPHPGYHNFMKYHNRTSYQIQPPGGTFYKAVKGKIVPIATPRAPRGVNLTNNFPSSGAANTGQSPL